MSASALAANLAACSRSWDGNASSPAGTAAIESGRPSGRRGVYRATSTVARSRLGTLGQFADQPGPQAHVRLGVAAQVPLAVDQDRRDPADQELLDHAQRGRRLATARRPQERGMPRQLGQLDRHRLAATVAGRADDDGIRRSGRASGLGAGGVFAGVAAGAVVDCFGAGLRSAWLDGPIQGKDRPQRREAGQAGGSA